MTSSHQADRYYQIMIAIAGLVCLIFTFHEIPQIETKMGNFLLLITLAGLFVQYPIRLFRDEITLVPLVALGGGFTIGSELTAWAVTLGILSGYTFRWLVREKRSWRLFLSINTWIKIWYRLGIICIPLIVTFSIFGYSNNINDNIKQGTWASTILVSFVLMGFYIALYLVGFIFQQRSTPYPNIRSDSFSLISIELFTIFFVLIIVRFYPEHNAESLALFTSIPILLAYLLYKLNKAQIEQNRHTRELSTLNQISSTIRSTLKLDELLPVIQEQVTKLFDVNNFYVALYDRERNELWYPLAVKLGQKQNWPRRIMADRLTDRVIQNGQIILLTPQTKPILAPVGLPPSEETPTSWLGVPLISPEHTIGCLAVFSLKSGKFFTKADADVLTILSGQTSVAIENALLYQQTQHHAHQLEMLNQLTASMTASLDLSEVLTRVCNSVAQVGGSQQSAIFILDQGEDSVSLAHKYGLDEYFQQRNAVFSVTNSKRSRCLRTGKPLVVPDIKDTSLSSELVLHFQADKIQAFADFPLITPDGQIGFLSVYFKEKHEFSQEEVGVLQTFASQAALAVANARLHARTDAALAQRVNQLTTLEAVGRVLSAASHSDQLFSLILQFALEMTNSSCGAVSIINPNTNNMKVMAAQGYRIQNDEFQIDNRITERVVRTYSVVNVGDISKDPDFLDFSDGDTRSQLSVPIIHEKRMLGIISLESPELNAYTESEESFVTQLANHAAIDIVNAELYHETQRRLQNQSSLYQASTKLVSAASPDHVAKTITQAIDAVIQPLEIGIYNWVDDTQKYVLIGEPNKHISVEIYPSSELTRYLNQDINLSALGLGHPLFESIAPRCQECHVFYFLLEMGHPRPGFVMLHIAQDRQISQNETELIKTIIAQGSIALQNAHNFLEAKIGRDRLAAILNAIEEAILMVDSEGHVLLANEPIRVLSGIPVEQFLETPIFKLPDQVLETLGFKQEEIGSIINSLSRMQAHVSPKIIYEVRDFQRTRIVERVTTPIWGPDRKIIGLMIVLRDITEAREIEQTREAITETIVHDVRSPMSAIVGALELLSDTLADIDNPVVEQTILVAQRSANRVLSLTEALLDIARMQSGRMEINYQDIDLPTLVSELMVEFTVLANDNSVIIRNDIPNQLPIIQADLDKLIRILTNLVDNAIKFSPQGGRVIISAELVTNQILAIKVIDSGPGVPTDYREKIFERFVQVPGQRSRRRGTGLGLAFCRLTIEAHGGKIWVDPNPEGGSIFTLILPITSPNMVIPLQ